MHKLVEVLIVEIVLASSLLAGSVISGYDIGVQPEQAIYEDVRHSLHDCWPRNERELICRRVAR